MGLTLTDRQDLEFSRLLAHTKAVRENWLSIVWLKDAIARDDEWAFKEVWIELGHDIHRALWLSQKKGGIWTPAEKQKMDEWKA